MILQGIKSWEMRKGPCRIRGRISLIQSSSGEIMGASDIVDTKGPLTFEELAANVDKHRSTAEALISKGMFTLGFLKIKGSLSSQFHTSTLKEL